MSNQIKIEDIPREIFKMVDRYQPQEVIDIICLQRDLNVLLSEVIVNHYNLTPLESEEINQHKVALSAFKDYADKPLNMKEVFEVATKELPQAIEQFDIPRDPNWTPFDESETVKVEIKPEPIPDKYNEIYIIDLPLSRYAITSYQFEQQNIEENYGNCILGAIDLTEWTTKHMVYLNAQPELRDKLVLDKLKYEDFLTLEGWEDTDPETEKIFDDMTKIKVELDPNEITPFDNIDGVLISEIEEEDSRAIQTAKEIAERYDIANFMAEDSPVLKQVEVDNWVPEVVHVQPVPRHPLHPLDTITTVTIEALPSEEETPPKPEFKLTDHQQEKFDGLIEKINSILSSQRNLVRPPNPAYYMTVLEGAAGTGKTTMMKKVLETLIDQGNKLIFCSPTHQALGVIRETLIEGEIEFTENNEEYMLGNQQLIIKTLASFLGIKMQRDEENGTETFEEDPKAPILTCDVLAIDESSMVSKDQLKILLRKLHINTKCILFIGDEVQLDSPSDNNESNGIFQLPQKFALEEVVRQAADNKILQLAWELRSYILAKNCPYPPSQLLHIGRSNENIIIHKDQNLFMQDYFQNENKSKLISTYTNKITNEYNDYVRQLRLTGTGVPLDIDISGDGSNKNIITNWDEYKEWYVGEECVALEPNQRNGDIHHQTGERFTIQKISEDIKKVSIEIIPDTHDLNVEPETKTFEIPYWKVEDTNGKIIWIIKKDFVQQYNEILQLLSLEAKRKIGKFKWAKYWDIKEKFIRVNKVFAFTLHKLQGSTCLDIYVDARDLDKFWSRMPVGVYKLIYIALTRPKQKVIFLIN